MNRLRGVPMAGDAIQVMVKAVPRFNDVRVGSGSPPSPPGAGASPSTPGGGRRDLLAGEVEASDKKKPRRNKYSKYVGATW